MVRISQQQEQEKYEFGQFGYRFLMILVQIPSPRNTAWDLEGAHKTVWAVGLVYSIQVCSSPSIMV